ncbi:MAG: DUF4845 domain-containing protein [Woeseiaceae bacterium]
MGASKNGMLTNNRQNSTARPVRRQSGMTTVGFLILIVFVGLFAFAGIRLTPVYLNYLKVAGVIDGVYDEFDSKNPSREAVRRSILRRFQVESVSELTDRDVKVTSTDGGFKVEAQYDHTTPFIANVHFTVRFDKSVVIRR